MKKQKKMLAALGMAACMTAAAVFPAFAEWKYDESVGKWWWREYDGSYPKSEPEDAGTYFATYIYIDGNGDGIAERYYFDENGYLYTDRTLSYVSMFDGETIELTVNSDGARCNDGKVETLKVITDQLPARMKGSFFNQTYVDLLGKDRAYVEGVVGRPSEEPEFSYGKVRCGYADEISIYYEAGKAREINLPAGKLFNYGKDSYTANEIASQLSVPNGDYGYDPYFDSYLDWYIYDENEPLCVMIQEGIFGTAQDGIINRNDRVSIYVSYLN